MNDVFPEESRTKLIMFSPKSLGYDRSQIFAPDGRLFQVEYANEAVRRGSSCLGLVAKDGVVFFAVKKTDEKQNKFLTDDSLSKIFFIEDHIILSGSGLLGDLQYLVSYARIQAQNLNLLYGEPASVQMLVRQIASALLIHTQIAGYRPFGVSLLISGVTKQRIQLFKIDPSGSFYSYYAIALGEGVNEIFEYLDKHFKMDLNLEQQLSFGVKALKQFYPNLENNQLEIVFIKNKTNIKYHKLTLEEINNYNPNN